MSVIREPSTIKRDSTPNIVGGQELFILGDDDPQDFSFTDGLNAKDVLSLIVRSGKARKVFWRVDQAFKLGIIFTKEQSISAPKHNNPNFLFESFLDWIIWTMSYEEIQKGIRWTEAFGVGKTFFFQTDEIPKESYKDTKIPYYSEILDKEGNTTPGDFSSCKSIYPMINGFGYELVEQEKDLNKTPIAYHIVLPPDEKVKDETDEKIEYYIHASRVVSSAALQIRLERPGESALQAAGKYIQVQDQIMRAVFAVANNVQAGIEVMRAVDSTEATAIKNKMKNSKVDRLTKLWYAGDMALDDIFKIIVPDLKTGQLTEMYLILQKEIATGLGISIKNLGEEDVPAGFGMSGKEEGQMLTHDYVHHLQNHYRRFMEECFFMLGKEDTTFEWVQPEIEEKSSDFNIGITNTGDKDEEIKNGGKENNEKED